MWVHLYGGSLLESNWKGSPIVLRQETDYPWEGAIRLTFEKAPAAPMALRLRIPEWASAAEFSVNGEVQEAVPSTYAAIERSWSDGDVVELRLPMAPQLVEAHPMIEEARNQVAVVRGPLVYCLESADVPEGVPLSEVVIPADIALEAQYDPSLLGGVVAIRAEALRRRGPDFSGGLYAPVSLVADEPVVVRFVPYYAWWNRGNGAMTVWLPRA